MAKNGLELANQDMAEQDAAATDKCRIVGDQATGYPTAVNSDNVAIPWGSAAPVAPEVKTSDFTITGADNASIYDCQGAITVTLGASVAAGVRVEIQQTEQSAVTMITGDSGVTLVSPGNNIDPVYLAQQGATLVLTSYGSDTWYLSAQAGTLSAGDVPLLIENCHTWYDFADYLNTTDAVNDLDPINNIYDKSVQGFDLTPDSTAAVINTNAQNGLAAFRSTGINAYGLNAGQLIWPDGNNTLFVVAWQPSEQNNQWPIGMDSSGSDWGLKTVAGEFEYHNGGQIKEGSGDLTQPAVMTGRREGNNLKLYRGLTQAGTSGNGSNPTVSDGALAGRGGTSDRWDGWIGEIIVYNRALTNAERETAIRYLGLKWGISV